MKKHLNLIISSAVVVLAICFMQSCKKDRNETSLQGKEDLLSTAESYYKRQLRSRVSSDTNDINIRNYKPDWNNAKLSKTAEGKDLINIPLYTSASGHIELTVLKEGDNVTGVIKRLDYATSKLYLYTGSGRLRSKGEYDAAKKVFTKDNYSNKFTTMSMGGELDEVPIYGEGPGPIIIIELPTNPPPTNPGEGGGGGGNGGSSSSIIIILKNTRPCISDIKNSITLSSNLAVALEQSFMGNVDYNSVAAMISRLASSPTWNVEIKEAAIPDTVDPISGATSTTAATTRGVSGHVEITMNTGYLGTATDLSVARTMIHEFMHAYFEYGLTQTLDPAYDSFVKANNLLFKKNGSQVGDQNDAQHEQIANSYVNGIANALEIYASTHSITSPDPALTLSQYCKDLAWGGLSDTNAYSKYAPNKSRVQDNLKNEATNNSKSTKKKKC